MDTVLNGVSNVIDNSIILLFLSPCILSAGYLFSHIIEIFSDNDVRNSINDVVENINKSNFYSLIEIKHIFEASFQNILEYNFTDFSSNFSNFSNNQLFYDCIKSWVEINNESNFKSVLSKMRGFFKEKHINNFLAIKNTSSLQEFLDLNIDSTSIKLIVDNIKKL